MSSHLRVDNVNFSLRNSYFEIADFVRVTISKAGIERIAIFWEERPDILPCTLHFVRTFDDITSTVYG